MIKLNNQLAPVPRVTQRLLNRIGKVSPQTTQATGPQLAAKLAMKTHVKAIKTFPATGSLG